MRPFSRRTVKQSSSACVGCSCAPSPALITGAPSTSAIRFGTPATAWRTTTASGSIASSVRAVSRMLSAFFSARARRREVDHVGREPLARDLEAGARARRGLEEQVDDGAAAQGRDLLHLALADLDHVLGGVEDALDVGALEVFDAEQIASDHAAPSPSAAARAVARETTITSSASAGPPPSAPAQAHLLVRVRRHVLADVVELDRQLAVAAVDEAHHLHRLRAAEVHQRVHRGADRAARLHHVVDEHDDVVVHRGGHLGAAQRGPRRRWSAGRRGRAWCRARRPAPPGPRPRAGSARAGAPAGCRRSGSPPDRAARAPRPARRSRARCAPASGGCRSRRAGSRAVARRRATRPRGGPARRASAVAAEPAPRALVRASRICAFSASRDGIKRAERARP